MWLLVGHNIYNKVINGGLFPIKEFNFMNRCKYNLLIKNRLINILVNIIKTVGVQSEIFNSY